VQPRDVRSSRPAPSHMATCLHSYRTPTNNSKSRYQRGNDNIIDKAYTKIRRGADKSLARPGRKEATATKLGIYSTYSPRSSIHFLVRCFNFYKPLKKFRMLSVQPGLHGSNDIRVGRKMTTFQLFFQSREKVVFRQGHIWRIGWVIKTLEAQVGQFLLVCKCPVSRGIVVQEQDLLRDLPVAFFLQNVLQLHQQR